MKVFQVPHAERGKGAEMDVHCYLKMKILISIKITKAHVNVIWPIFLEK